MQPIPIDLHEWTTRAGNSSITLADDDSGNPDRQSRQRQFCHYRHEAQYAVDATADRELSFVERESDVTELRRRLVELGGEHLAVVLEIETVNAFNHLPDPLAAMASERVGVIARPW